MKTVCNKFALRCGAVIATTTLALFGIGTAASAADAQTPRADTPNSDSGSGLMVTLIIGAVVVLVGGFLLLRHKQSRRRQPGVELKTCGGCKASDQVGNFCTTCGATLPPDTGVPNEQPIASRPPRGPSAYQ